MTSYSTIADATAYFEERLYTSAWTAASESDQQKALNMATRLIDRLRYKGTKVELDQEHEFPRKELYIDDAEFTGTPEAILIAQYEITLALLKGIDVEKEIAGLRVTSRGYASVRTTYDSTLIPEHLLSGIPSALAWSYLSAYLDRDTSGIVTVHRVS